MSLPILVNLLLITILKAAPSWPFGKQPSISFPSDFYAINVKDYGAKGDGKTDDTTSIQTAINAQTSYQLLYFPPGTYMISSPLLYANGTGLAKRRYFEGESVSTTTIKLMDDSKAYSDATKPKPMLKMGTGVAQNFFNQIIGITFNTGNNNPGAIAVQFDANNEGCIRNVSIISPDLKSMHLIILHFLQLQIVVCFCLKVGLV